MSDGYRDEHLRRHKIAHDAGESCSICGQLPDGSYPFHSLSEYGKIDNLHKRVTKLEELIDDILSNRIRNNFYDMLP